MGYYIIMKKTLYTASTAAILLASVVAPNAAFAAENPVVENQPVEQSTETVQTVETVNVDEAAKQAEATKQAAPVAKTTAAETETKKATVIDSSSNGTKHIYDNDTSNRRNKIR